MHEQGRNARQNELKVRLSKASKSRVQPVNKNLEIQHSFFGRVVTGCAQPDNKPDTSWPIVRVEVIGDVNVRRPNQPEYSGHLLQLETCRILPRHSGPRCFPETETNSVRYGSSKIQ